MEAMQPANILFFLAVLGMLATVIVLFPGIRSMTEEPNTDPHHSIWNNPPKPAAIDLTQSKTNSLLSLLIYFPHL